MLDFWYPPRLSVSNTILPPFGQCDLAVLQQYFCQTAFSLGRQVAPSRLFTYRIALSRVKSQDTAVVTRSLRAKNESSTLPADAETSRRLRRTGARRRVLFAQNAHQVAMKSISLTRLMPLGVLPRWSATNSVRCDVLYSQTDGTPRTVSHWRVSATLSPPGGTLLREFMLLMSSIVGFNST